MAVTDRLAGDSAPPLLCFGDSLTEGYAVDPGDSYPALLQERLRQEGHAHRVVNQGRSGDTSGDALARLDWALRVHPRVAVVALGANDAFQGVPRPLLEANLAEIIQRLQRGGATVVLAGLWIPRRFGLGDPAGLQALYHGLARHLGTPLVPDLMAGVLDHPGLVLMDGFHPNGAGYRVIMENVWRVLTGPGGGLEASG
ncbi:MAG: arylesterase [Magnetococcales bacterium]|nr:arylesterase [Magnetococcales bacterium]